MEAEAEGKQALTLMMVPVVCPQLSPSLLHARRKGKKAEAWKGRQEETQEVSVVQGPRIEREPITPGTQWEARSRTPAL